MAKVVLNEDILQAAVAGGSFYGGGGGGSPALGLRLGRLALGLESEKPLHRAGASGRGTVAALPGDLVDRG